MSHPTRSFTVISSRVASLPRQRVTEGASMRKWMIGGIIAVSVVTLTGGGLAFAGNDGEGGASGPEADRAIHAALDVTGGGTVGGVERDGENGAVWEVEVHKTDGAVVDVRLDGDDRVVVIEGDSEKADVNDGG